MNETTLIELDRRPIVLSESEDASDDALFDELTERPIGLERSWVELLRERRVVLLIGPAHCGKTSELRLLRGRLRASDRQCFLLDMALVVRQSVEVALGEEAEAFDAWLSADAEAVVLLDALDEAALCDERALMICLHKVVGRLTATGVERCKFVISSRPGAWSRSDVLQEIRTLLAARTQSIQSVDSDSQKYAVADEAPSKIASYALCAAMLSELKPAQLDRLLREKHLVADPALLRRRAWQLGLGFATRSPGALRWLVSTLSAIGDNPTGRLEALETAVSALASSAYKHREQRISVSQADFVRDLERICAAGFFAQTYVFALHDAIDLQGATSLRELLAHREVAYESFVHSSPFFIDAALQRIKFVPEELLPYLAARWLAARIAHSEISADEVFDQLFLKTSFTGNIVPSQLEVTAGWLAAMDVAFARRLISVAPHAAFLYGDLGRHPAQIARGAFMAIKNALLEGKPLFFRTVRLTPDDFYQAMRPELVHDVVGALAVAQSNLDLLDLLLRLVSSRGIPEAVPALRKLLVSPDLSEHSLPRLIDAFGECGSKGDVEWAVDELFLTSRMSNRVATRAYESLLQRSASPRHLRSVVDTGWVDAIAASVFTEDCIFDEREKDQAFALFDGLRTACAGPSRRGSEATEADQKGNETSLDQDDESDLWQSGVRPRLLAAGLRALLTRRDLVNSDLSRLVDWLEELRILGGERGADLFDDIEPLVAENPDLHALALTRLLAEIRTSEQPWLNSSRNVYAVPQASDVPLILRARHEEVDEERRLALSHLVERLQPRSLPSMPSAKDPNVKSVPSSHHQSPQVNGVSVAQALQGVEALRSAADIILLLRLVWGIFPEDHHTALRRWSKLAASFGVEVVDALQEGLRRLWREHPPLHAPERPNEVFALTVAGLLGLESELVNRGAAEGLSDQEALRALEYSIFNTNRLPAWIEYFVEKRFAMADEFFGRTIAKWADSPAALRHARETVSRLPTRLAREGPACRAAAWEIFRSEQWENQPGLERLLAMLCLDAGDPALAHELPICAQLAWLSAAEGWLPMVSAWIRVEPSAAITFLASQVKFAERKADIVLLASHWSFDGFPLAGYSDLEALAPYLEQLYVLISQAAPSAEDPYRIGVFTPTRRDNAAQLRSSLLAMIENVGGRAGYAAFSRLARRWPSDRQGSKMFATFATKVAEAAALPAKWSTAEFVKYSADVALLPVSSEQALWTRVRRDIQAIVRNVQSGRFHVGSLLKEGAERDMQLWMARELELLARGSYSVTREGELANRTMPDVVAEAAGKQVALELKLGDRRTVESLMRDLEHQLLNDYLGDIRSNFGIFVVMVKNENKSFLYGGRRIDVRGLEQTLQARSRILSSDSSARNTVAVVVFSLAAQTLAKARRHNAASPKRRPSGGA